MRLLLLEKGVGPDSKDKYGQTPLLSLAVESRHEAVVKLQKPKINLPTPAPPSTLRLISL